MGCADVRFNQFHVLCPTVNSPTFFLAHSRDQDQLTKDIERENIVVAGKKFNASICGTTVRNGCIWICKLGCAIVRTPTAENFFYFFFFSVFQKDAVTNAIKEHMREHIRKVLDTLMLMTKTRECEEKHHSRHCCYHHNVTRNRYQDLQSDILFLTRPPTYVSLACRCMTTIFDW